MNRYAKIFGIAMLPLFLMGNQGGCTQAPDGTIIINTPDVPPHLLKCLPKPMRDKKVVRISPKQAAVLIARMDTVIDDCKDKLERVRIILQTSKGSLKD